MANQVNTTIVRDDEYIYFGTSGPFRMRYSVTNTRLELTDAAGNVLAHWTDAGTTGNMTVTGTTTSAGVTVSSNFLTITPGTATIASGVITATSSIMVIDTEAAAATDDLDTINGHSGGRILWVTSANSARDIVLKDGTGNLDLGADITIQNTGDYVGLVARGGSNWKLLSKGSV